MERHGFLDSRSGVGHSTTASCHSRASRSMPSPETRLVELATDAALSAFIAIVDWVAAEIAAESSI